jgi:hypothetical protein
MLMSYGIATPPIDLLRPCLGASVPSGSLPVPTWPSIAGIPASSVHHLSIGGSQLSFNPVTLNPSTPLHVYYAYAAAAAAMSLRLSLVAQGTKRQFVEAEAGQQHLHQHSSFASQGGYACQCQKTAQQQQQLAVQQPQTQHLAQLWLVSPAAICQPQPWAQRQQQLQQPSSTAPLPAPLLMFPRDRLLWRPSEHASQKRTRRTYYQVSPATMSGLCLSSLPRSVHGFSAKWRGGEGGEVASEERRWLQRRCLSRGQLEVRSRV